MGSRSSFPGMCGHVCADQFLAFSSICGMPTRRGRVDPTGTNLPAVGEYNQAVVLDAIRRRPEGITRSELAGLTALSGMTVTKVCRRLLDAGLVEEHGTRMGGPGKPATGRWW